MLHLQARALLDLIEQRGTPPLHTLAPREARLQYLERRHFTQPSAPQIGSVRDLHADGPAGPISLRLYLPPGRGDGALPVLAYFHGGGFVIGDLDTHDTLCRELCLGSGCAIVAVDYRLAPEHRFPAAVEDAWAATLWIHRNAAALGLDASRLAVGGDSAGANLATVVARLARDAGGPAIAWQLLVYPTTDARCVAPSHESNGRGYLLTKDLIRYFMNHYLGPGGDAMDPRVSPLLAADHSRLPPAFVLTAGYDPLHDEGVDYAQRLSQAGTPSTAVCFERQIHGFLLMGRVLDEARAAVELCAAGLRRALRG